MSGTAFNPIRRMSRSAHALVGPGAAAAFDDEHTDQGERWYCDEHSENDVSHRSLPL
jgi:hypothetical protein